MADHSLVGIVLRHLDRLHRLTHSSNLVYFDQYRICYFFLDPSVKPLCVCHKEIVSDKLNFIANPSGQLCPAVPVILRQTILYRNNGIALDQLLIIGDHFLCGAPDHRLIVLDIKLLARLIACTYSIAVHRSPSAL